MAASLVPVFRGPLLVLLWVSIGHLTGTFVLCDPDSTWSSSRSGQPYVNFVLVGATGNLAQKYLWQGLYDLSRSIAATGRQQTSSSSLPSNARLALYGGARADNATGAAALEGILKSKVRYEDGDSREEQEAFVKSVSYVQLKTCQDYERFCANVLNSADYDENGGYCQKSSCGPLEIGRVFYLAVTPYSYGELAECIHRVCRPPLSTSWLRLVLEKPYGSDLVSVTALTTALLQNFAEEEVYLIDHYLGKAAVKQMLPFRYQNREWLEPLLNNEFVERIEVVIKEKEDAEGRLQFYDSYGVFLDILQNHAMEVLTLIAMDLPPDLDDPQQIRNGKIRFLKTVAPIRPSHLIAGQYADYVLHGQQQFKDDQFSSRTATYGAVLLRAPSPRWRGVPIVLISGKALDEKTSYVRVVFKDSFLDLGNRKSADEAPSVSRDMMVTINSQSEGVLSPSISIAKSVLKQLPAEVLLTSTWPLAESSSNSYATFHYVGEDRAYSVVVADIVRGRRDSFVGLEQLTASWNMWTLAVEHLASDAFLPRIYGSGDMVSLRFRWSPDGLEFADRSRKVRSGRKSDEIPDRFLSLLSTEGSGAPTLVPVIMKPTPALMERLASDLLKNALECQQQNRPFHVAFPGGRTPKPLFHLLTSEGQFPWEDTHIWFVDERCVPFSHPESNVLNAQEQLLKHVGVPHSQVHPMPVLLARGLCHSEDLGTVLYESWLKSHAANGSLDTVVLGVGADGHLASIFPRTSDASGGFTDDNGAWVQLSKAPPSATVQNRMTLTLNAIRRARKLFVVITGKEKHGVVRSLLDGDQQAVTLPVWKVLDHGEVTLYIDQDAYEGPR